MFISAEWSLWVSSFLCLSVFPRFSILNWPYTQVKRKKLSYINSFLALPALAVTLNIPHHLLWMLTWTVWEVRTNMSWHTVSVAIASTALCSCHLWFSCVLVVGCLILWVLFVWTHEHMDVSTPPFPAKALLWMWHLSLTLCRCLVHKSIPGQTEDHKMKTDKSQPSYHKAPARKHLEEQPSLGWYTHHRLSYPRSQGPHGCEWVCFRFVKKKTCFCKNQWTIDQESVFTMSPSDKGLPSRMDKDFLWIDNKEAAQLKKRAKDLNKNFIKEDLGMANTPIKRSSASLIIRNMQFKATMKYHFVLIRLAEIKKVMTLKVGQDMEQLGSQFLAIMGSV